MGKTGRCCRARIAGLRVRDAREIGSELELVVETTPGRGWCRVCGVQAAPKATFP